MEIRLMGKLETSPSDFSASLDEFTPPKRSLPFPVEMKSPYNKDVESSECTNSTNHAYKLNQLQSIYLLLLLV